MKHLLTCAFVFFILASPSAFALSLQVDATGQLTGATGVDVGGSLYDVHFMDGTCIAVFSGCDNASDDFTFTTQAGALEASTSLLSQVFLDTSLGNFDQLPALTKGCENLLPCIVVTPYNIGLQSLVTGSIAVNSVINASDVAIGNGAVIDMVSDLILADDLTWAVWTRNQTAPIPEPSTFLLLGSGLAGLAGWQYRKKQYK